MHRFEQAAQFKGHSKWIECMIRLTRVLQYSCLNILLYTEWSYLSTIDGVHLLMKIHENY